MNDVIVFYWGSQFWCLNIASNNELAHERSSITQIARVFLEINTQKVFLQLIRR